MMQTELRLFDLTVLIYKIGIKKIEFLASVYMFLCQIWKKKTSCILLPGRRMVILGSRMKGRMVRMRGKKRKDKKQ